MKLPNAENAIVDREKVEDYLLNASHPDNGGKAEFFTRHGFQAGDWKQLADALLALARENNVASRSASRHGQKFVIIASIWTPSGKAASVQTIWIMDAGAEVARLVTAYPAKK